LVVNRSRCRRAPATAAIGKRREVRHHAGHGLIAPDVVPEAGDHLVEDQQRAGAVAEVAQAGEEARLGEQSRRVVRDRLDQDRGDLAVVALERHADVLEVVEAADDRRVDRGLEHPLGVRVTRPDARGSAERVPEDVVVEAVVTALELDDLLASRDTAGEADGVERGLRAAVAHDDLLRGGHVPDDRLGQRDLGLRHTDAEQHRVAHRRGDALDHRRMGVAEQDRAVRGVVVDVAAAVEVLDVRTLAAADAEPRLAAPAARVHAAGDHLGGLVQQQLRPVHPAPPESK